jgi:hypothetical protein
MNRGCLKLSGLSLISLFIFGVTLEAINDPKELSAIPFRPWDFVTYGIIALAILFMIRIFRRPDPRKTLVGQWTSYVTRKDTQFRATMRLDPDGTAELQTEGKAVDSEQKLHTSARWQLLDDRTLHLLGAQEITWKIRKLSGRSMTTATSAELASPVHWLKRPKINIKACLLIAGSILLPILIALSLPHSGSSHAIAEDPQSVPPNASRYGH